MNAPQPLSRVSEIAVYGASRPRTGAIHQLSSNENPYGPPAGVAEAVARSFGTPNRYPDLYADGLAYDLALRLQADPAQVLVGPGSLSLLESLLRAYVGEGHGVVSAWRSYEAYPNLLTAIGAQHRRVPLREGRHDLGSMAAAIDDHTRAVIVCNPNNPTGTAVSPDQLTAFLHAVPPGCLVILDEAYREFVAGAAMFDGVEAARQHPNVVVLRTFSKAFGLAGLRVGYLVGRPEVVDPTRRLVLPFAVSRAATEAAMAALAASDEIASQVRSIVEDRERLVAALRERRIPVTDSEANFVWLPLGPHSDAFTASLLQQGFTVRCFTGEGVRISVGDAFATSELIRAIRTI